MATKAETRKQDEIETRGRLADLIAAEAPHNRVELIGLLQSQEGLKLEEKNGLTVARMAGIEAEAHGGEMQAIVNWGNKARRWLRTAL